MPLLVAPVAFQRVAHPEGEVATARAARDAGTIMCLSTLATSTPAEVAAVGGPCWFQLYVFRDEGVTRELIAQARDSGYRALVLTIDAPVRGNRERDARTAFAIPPDITVASLGRGGITPQQVFEMISPSLTWHDLERIAGEAGMPLLVKGVLTAEDAVLACEHGAAGIVVSNHGGRQLDGVSATIDALPEVVAAVDGRMEVLVDGGIRRGSDVVKALALGAQAVLAGRAVLWGLATSGEERRPPRARDLPFRDPERIAVAGLRVAGRGRPRPHRAPVGRLPCRHEGGRRRPGRRSRGARRRRRAAACRRGRLRPPRHDAALDRLRGSRRADRPEAGDDSRRLLRHGRAGPDARGRRRDDHVRPEPEQARRDDVGARRSRHDPGQGEAAVRLRRHGHRLRPPADRRERALRRANTDAVEHDERPIPRERAAAPAGARRGSARHLRSRSRTRRTPAERRPTGGARRRRPRS